MEIVQMRRSKCILLSTRKRYVLEQLSASRGFG
ncbi:unnamed protein product, partial [Allacma fusca]